MAKFYDPLTQQWYTMPEPLPIVRPSPRTPASDQQEKAAQNLRIAQNSFLWQAIEATATATQMSTCPAGSDKAESES